MARQVLIKNYNNLSGGVITDFNKLAGVPENAVKDALNFEFSATDGASRRKAIDLESGIAGSSYVQNDSDLALGITKQQVFTFKSVLDAFDTPTHDIVFNTFEGKGVVYDLGSDQQLADAVADAAVDPNSVVTEPSTEWRSVVWSPELGLFVAVGLDATNPSPVMVSESGEYWSRAKSYSETPPAICQSVTWAPELGLFVAVGLNSYLTSSDGYNWDVYSIASTSFFSVTWCPLLSIFVAVGAGIAYTSPDGVTWTSRTISASRDWRSVTWAPELGLFVAVCYITPGGQCVTTSPNGITWTLRTTPATDRAWYDVTWSPELGKLCAVGFPSYAMTSSDGITWAEVATVGGNLWNSITWSPELNLFVAVAQSGVTRVMSSPDGTTWTGRTIDALVWEGVTWSPELSKFVVVGEEVAVTSSDGITFSAPTITSDYSDWISLKGIPVGTSSTSTGLQLLYNTNATTYKVENTLGLGSGPLIRDFTGVYDTLNIDENPIVTTFTVGSISGTFTEGEDISITDGAATTRRFRIIDLRSASVWGVDKSLGTVDTDFDGASTVDYSTFSVTGKSSGASATLTSHVGVGLSDAHRYNLINQGWTQGYMDTYGKSIDSWPSNAQTWYSGRDGSNNFSPTELNKIAFGNSESPKGHILLHPFREWRHAKVPGVYSGSVQNATYTRGFTTLATFSSRLALSGANINGVENTVYISPILVNKLVTSDSPSIVDLDFSEVFKFYQRNDPTADIQNELLPDDGVVIPVAGANKIYKVIELSNALVVIADNGVWAISGIDLQSGFTTDAFSVYKIIGASGSTNARSVVSTSEAVYYWSSDGIYAISSESGGAFVAANITINRIGGLYKAIPPDVREATISYYDEYNHKIYWAYNGETTATYPEFRNKLLVLDLELNVYYPLKMPYTLTDSEGHLSAYFMTINGFTQDPSYPNTDGTVPLKLMVTEVVDNTTADFKHSIMEFSNDAGLIVFDDFSAWRNSVHSDTDAGVDEDVYIQTWDDSLGDTSRSKQAIWIFTHMEKTETGWEDLGGGALGPIGESGLLLRNQWDWHNSSAGGKWGSQKQIYKHARPYVPVDDTDTYDTGESVITTKKKVYGRGRALSLRFDAEANKDAILYGFSIPYSAESAP